MNCDEFLSALRHGLKGLNPQEVDDIVSDYRAYFSEGRADGRTEQEVADALGDPLRLARELRTEAGLRQWESRPTPGTFLTAILALLGLAALDLIVLIPIIFVLLVTAFALGVAVVAVTLVGVAILASVVHWGPFDDWSDPVSRVLAGLGLVSGGIGWGAVLLLAMGIVLRVLGKFARLHYQLITPTRQNA